MKNHQILHYSSLELLFFTVSLFSHNVILVDIVWSPSTREGEVNQGDYMWGWVPWLWGKKQTMSFRWCENSDQHVDTLQTNLSTKFWREVWNLWLLWLLMLLPLSILEKVIIDITDMLGWCCDVQMIGLFYSLFIAHLFRPLSDLVEMLGGVNNTVVDIFGENMNVCAADQGVDSTLRYSLLRHRLATILQPSWLPTFTETGKDTLYLMEFYLIITRWLQLHLKKLYLVKW